MTTLADLLSATEQGRARLALYGSAWPHSPEEIRARVPIHGCDSVLPLIVDALMRVPDCVCESTLTEVVWLTVGRRSGFTCSARLPDNDGAERHRVIVLGAGASARLIWHEVAHCWHAPLPRTDGIRMSALTETAERDLRQLANAAEWNDQIREHEGFQETLADELGDLFERGEQL